MVNRGESMHKSVMTDGMFNSHNFIGIYAGRTLDKIEGIKNSVDHISSTIDKIVYYINPANWVKDSLNWLHINMLNGSLDESLLVVTIVVIWLTMFGAKRPKKYCFWTWVLYLILRGFVFIK